MGGVMEATAMTKNAAYHPPTIDEIESALSYISPDMERGEWAKIGMAIKSELGDGGLLQHICRETHQ